MNIVRKRIAIYLSLTLLFTMACDACYILPGAERNLGDIKCVSDGYQYLGGTTTYTCHCPMDSKYVNITTDITAKDFADPVGLKSKACTDYYRDQAAANPPVPIIPATEPPTEAPTEPPTEPPLTSILDNKVSYCSVNNGEYYLNLPFNSSADPSLVQTELDNGDLIVQIEGKPTSGRCKVLAANNMILCAFPADDFPAFSSTAPNTIINVIDKGTIIDHVPFSNSCEGPQPLNTGGSTTGGDGGTGGTGGTGSIPACDPHTDTDPLSCPLDCSNPANADLCG